jgi:hypothetical protein
VPREVFWWVLVQKGVLQKYIALTKDMYDGACRSVRSCAGVITEFPIGVHQGSAVNHFLFATVMDELICAIQEVVHDACCLLMMLF